MRKRIRRGGALLVALAMSCSMCVGAYGAQSGSLDHFKRVRTYNGNFSDVSGWYASSVASCYELGLIDGTSDQTFLPNSSLTVGEAVKLAACLHSIYETGSADFAVGSPWWGVYADYCMKNGISDGYSDYSAAITRAQFAELFSRALPGSVLTQMNDVPNGAIPDVSESSTYGAAVYLLYRAGILTGTDAAGTFKPQMTLLRSEMVTILDRMVNVSARQSLELPGASRPNTPGSGNSSVVPGSGGLTAEEIYAKCESAVFRILIHDKKGQVVSWGSGVFIEENGVAVTNWHVIDSAAKITISLGGDDESAQRTVEGIYDYHVKGDMAIIKVRPENGEKFSTIPISTQAVVPAGSKVYAIGNPQGLENTISEGIVSASNREIDGVKYIQVTAPISGGSSGGALINANGELIGLTAASIESGQNLNLAVPITGFSDLKTNTLRSVETVMKEYVDRMVNGFTITKYALDLNVGESSTITCTIPDVPPGYSISYGASIYNAVECSWSAWKDDHTDLRVTGALPAKMTLTINFHDPQGIVLAQKTVTVTVKQR